MGYLQVKTEDKGDAPKFVKHAAEGVSLFKAMKVRGVIVDLRGNNGGDDQPSANLVSLFYTGDQSLPYPYADIDVGTIKPNRAEAFGGRVAVLTDPLCVSDCEGIAYALKHTLGANRTRQFSLDATTTGAFGLVDDTRVHFPGGITLRQLFVKDKEPMKGRRFLIEANEKGVGGVPADVVVTPNADNLRRIWQKGEDLVLSAAVEWLAT